MCAGAKYVRKLKQLNVADSRKLRMRPILPIAFGEERLRAIYGRNGCSSVLQECLLMHPLHWKVRCMAIYGISGNSSVLQECLLLHPLHRKVRCMAIFGISGNSSVLQECLLLHPLHRKVCWLHRWMLLHRTGQL